MLERIDTLLTKILKLEVEVILCTLVVSSIIDGENSILKRKQLLTILR